MKSCITRAVGCLALSSSLTGCPIPDDYPYPDDAETLPLDSGGESFGSDTARPDVPDSGAGDSTLADVSDTADSSRPDAVDAADAADTAVVDASDTASSDSGVPDADAPGVDSDVCPRNSIYCAGATLRKCAADGGSWTTLETCATAELCAAGAPTGCATPSCDAGQKKCSGTDLQVCNPGRTGFALDHACGVTCASDACVDVASLAGGGYFSCAVLTDGSARCWGQNTGGQLGDGTVFVRTTPVVVGGAFKKTAIDVGVDHVCVIAADTSLQCWGTDVDYELLGASGDVSSATPVRVGTFTGAVAIATGETHSCAALADGKALCWGTNDGGQLGNNTTTLTTTSPPWSPAGEAARSSL